MHKADLVICLLSPDFIASEFCREKELEAALEAHKKGEQIVAPIRIRKCKSDILPVGKIHGSPKNWMKTHDNDDIWYDVVEEIVKPLKL